MQGRRESPCGWRVDIVFVQKHLEFGHGDDPVVVAVDLVEDCAVLHLPEASMPGVETPAPLDPGRDSKACRQGLDLQALDRALEEVRVVAGLRGAIEQDVLHDMLPRPVRHVLHKRNRECLSGGGAVRYWALVDM